MKIGKIAKILGSTKVVKSMSERVNLNFRVDIVGVVDYSIIDVIFDDGVGDEDVFQICVDDDWFLCADYKLRQCEECAELFTKGKYKDIKERAMMAVAAVMDGKCKKEVNLSS